jgi:hypothetical protein
LLAILTPFSIRMFILESSQTPLHQTCLAGTDPFLMKANNIISQILPSINSCIFTMKHCQVPHLLPIEKAHLRAPRVSYRSALLALLCPHKGKAYVMACLGSGTLEFLHLFLIFPLLLQVWYEWAVTTPTPSPVHNSNGRSYWVGL